jgi:2-hydroxy-3-keto-5-methylthiopentenyl-1-phosphate phosphatase
MWEVGALFDQRVLALSNFLKKRLHPIKNPHRQSAGAKKSMVIKTFPTRGTSLFFSGRASPEVNPSPKRLF